MAIGLAKLKTEVIDLMMKGESGDVSRRLTDALGKIDHSAAIAAQSLCHSSNRFPVPRL